MRLLLVSALAALAVMLAGCKPPKFDQMIVCPAFEAHGVAVYQQGGVDIYYVLFPDHTLVKVDRTECVIAAADAIVPERAPRHSNEHAE